MSIQRAEQLLVSIESSIRNAESHRATVGLLDFIRDYTLYEEDLLESIELRKRYNSSRELGKSDISAEEAAPLLADCDRLFQKIKAYSYTELEQELLSRYPTEPLIYAEDLEKSYPNQKKFKLGPVSTVLKPGEITGIVGENGNGKTTLLRILARLLSFDKGQLLYSFNEGLSQSDYEVKHNIAYIPQRLEKWNGTLQENLRYAATIHGIHGHDNDLAVEYVIHRMGLSNFAHLGWSELSSGYKLRFELARMLVWSPKVLVLDEPLANLDINAQQWLMQDFKHLAASLKNPVSIVMSSQQLHEVENVADNIIFLRNGSCDYSGGAKTFMEDRSHNVFELSGNFTINQLQEIFKTEGGCSCAESGLSVTLRTPRETSSSEVLTKLIAKGYTLHYFRDISTSTKQLFHL